MNTVTVVLPVRNGERWLDECLASISAQSRAPDEVIIVDDGSTDASASIARAWEGGRARLLEGPEKGLFAALALGVEAAAGDLIARMDQDDVAHPSRIENQYRVLREQSDVVACGSWARMTWGRFRARSFRPPTSSAGVRRFMGLGNPLVHSSVVFRREAVLRAGNYWAPGREPYPEDFHLWLRLLHQGTIVNIAQELMIYRRQSTGLAITGRNTIGRAAAELAIGHGREILGEDGMIPSAEAIVRAYHRSAEPDDRFTMGDARQFLGSLTRAGGGEPSRRLFPLSTYVRLAAAAVGVGK